MCILLVFTKGLVFYRVIQCVFPVSIRAFFFSWYNFLVSIPLEIKIKYYELDGLARLVVRWLTLFSFQVKYGDEMIPGNRIVAILFPKGWPTKRIHKKAHPAFDSFFICAAVGWVDFGGFALTKSQQARTKQFKSCLKRIDSVRMFTSNCQTNSINRWRCEPSSTVQLSKPLLLASKQTRGKYRKCSKSI